MNLIRIFKTFGRLVFGALIDFENVLMILMLLKFPWNDRLGVLIELIDINAKLQRVLGGHKGRWGSTANDSKVIMYAMLYCSQNGKVKSTSITSSTSMLKKNNLKCSFN